MGEWNGTVTSKQALILSTCYSIKSSDKRKQATTSSLSTRISKTYHNSIIKFKWCGSSLKNEQNLAAFSDICGDLQISGSIFRYLWGSSDICTYHRHIKEILTCHMEYTESLPPPPGIHKAWPTRPRSVSHWPGLAGLKSRPVICRQTWLLANTA